MAQNRLLPRRRRIRLLIGAAAVVVAAIGVTGVGQGASPEAITLAPAFTSADLAKPASTDWATNGGSTMNQRYSTLTQIDTSNVSKLKGVWRTHLRGRALAAKYAPRTAM